MVTARRAPVVRTSSAIGARLLVVMLARGHSAPAPRHLSERRTLIGGPNLMVKARRPPIVRTFSAIGTRPRVIARARNHSAPFQSNYLPSVSWSENAKA
ncbi:hypothetical protein T492DRAFT_954661, partial [Pavlovales sp. CCMP2436]